MPSKTKRKGRPRQVQYLLEPKLCSTKRFRDQLEMQLGFLRKSAAAFDAGDETEAVRLAGTLRTLLHNPKRGGRSLLSHLGIQDTLRFVDTGIYRDRLRKVFERIIPQGSVVASESSLETGLIEFAVRTDGTGKWIAPLREQRSDYRSAAHVPASIFDDWWNTTLIETEDGHLSRCDLVHAMADKDGYAHVDAFLNTHYERLSNEEKGIAFAATPHPAAIPGGIAPSVTGNAAYASVRQIAYEFLLTLERFLASKAGKCYTQDGAAYRTLTPIPTMAERGLRPTFDVMPIIYGTEVGTDE